MIFNGKGKYIEKEKHSYHPDVASAGFRRQQMICFRNEIQRCFKIQKWNPELKSTDVLKSRAASFKNFAQGQPLRFLKVAVAFSYNTIFGSVWVIQFAFHSHHTSMWMSMRRPKRPQILPFALLGRSERFTITFKKPKPRNSYCSQTILEARRRENSCKPYTMMADCYAMGLQTRRRHGSR